MKKKPSITQSSSEVIHPTIHMPSALWREYFALCKPKVVLLLLITAVVGMHLATPTWVPFDTLIIGTLGIGLAAAAAAVVNHIVDEKIDILMMRTQGRPIPQGQLYNHHKWRFIMLVRVYSM